MNNITNPTILNLATSLFGSMSPEQQLTALKGMKTPIPGMLNKKGDALLANADFGKAIAGENAGIGLGQLGATALGAAKAHPFKTAGLVGLGAGNLGGLTDNDKFGGQLGGLALGGLGASALASGNPYLAAMLTLGGGELGSLFDKLRAQKEQQVSQVPYGGR